MSATAELPKKYAPAEHESRIWRKWSDSGSFDADPERVLHGGAKPYCILIPPPNVTAALHLGHALNNTLQDVLVRAHRMKGFEALWLPGTDHAGIATQTVVEKRVLAEEGKRRTDFERDEFVARVQAFKDEYEARITEQLKAMGCSCDWRRQRFTMDPICARAVREAFFRLFRDGLIERGKRLVNWDPVTQTALADDEVENREIDGQFTYLRYPLCHPPRNSGDPHDVEPVTWSELAARGYPGAEKLPDEERAWLTVATTRPETYLGDTAVAVNPRDPRAGALRGLMCELPLVGRFIPIIEDDYVVLPVELGGDEDDPKAQFATGFLKVTPAHDPNDWELGVRHADDIRARCSSHEPVINVLAPDGSISADHGWVDFADHDGAEVFVGKSREEAAKLVVKEFEARGLLEKQVPYRHSVGHSYRSHAAIEPYLSDQWYVKVTDPRLRGFAQRALVEDQRSVASLGRGSDGATKRRSDEGSGADAWTYEDALEGGTSASEGSAPDPGWGLPVAGVGGDGQMRFYPERYARTYETWHDNLRDWCISRQLWWGHRIPVWHKRMHLDHERLIEHVGLGDLIIFDAGNPASKWFVPGNLKAPKHKHGRKARRERQEDMKLMDQPAACLLLKNVATGECFEIGGPDDPSLPERTPIAAGEYDAFICLAPDQNEAEGMLEEMGFTQDPDVLDTWFSSALWPLNTMGWPEPPTEMEGLLEAFNPTSVLCTAREIITLWVSRMVMFNRYFLGTHEGAPSVSDGPLTPGQLPFRDVFIHAMIQDGEGRKMSKSLGNGVDPGDIIHSHGADAMRFTLCHMTTQTQDVRMPVEPDPETGHNTSPKFDIGRNFCNKLWNAARFTISMLDESGDTGGDEVSPNSLIDRWMLSRLARGIAAIDENIAGYEFSVYAQTMYDLLWRDFCDWYLEGVKPTVKGDPAQRAVLRCTLDAVLRLLHPVTPFVTEALFEHLGEVRTASVAGLELGEPRKGGTLCTAGWPIADPSLIDEQAEAAIECVRELVNAIREVRAQHRVPPRHRVTLHTAAKLDDDAAGLVRTLAGVETITSDEPAGAAVAFNALGGEHRLSDLADEVDAGAERERLARQQAELDKSIAALEGRLNNPGYTDKAPAHLVEQTREQHARALADRDAVVAQLERLG